MKNGATLTVDVTNAVSATLNLGISGGASNGNGTLDFSAGTSVLSVGTSLVIGDGAKTGSIVMTSGGTLLLGGGVTVTTAGTWSPGTGTVNYNAAGTQTVDTTFFTFYNNLTLSGSGAKTTTGATVNGILSLQDTATASAAPTYGASAVLQYAGSSSQTTGPELTATIPNLTINNANGVTLNSSPTISGTLTLTSGNIATGSNTVIIASSGSVSRTSGHVIGNLQKYVTTGATSITFEVGEVADYDPVAVAFGSVSVAGNLTAKVTNGEHANIASSTINPGKDVNDYWSLTNSAITFDSYSATFTFAPGDVDVSANTSAFIVGRYSSGWTYPTIGTRTATSTQATGLTSLSDFVIGELLNTWVSYNDAAHTVPDDLFQTGENTVYMHGQGFQASNNYAVAYYNGSVTGGGQKVATDSGLIAGASSNLSSLYLLTTDPSAAPGTWHAVAFDEDLLPGGGPPTNYSDAAATSGYVIDDSFEVTAAAIPEFPTIIAAIAVAGICFVIYYWLRKRSLAYVRVKA